MSDNIVQPTVAPTRPTISGREERIRRVLENASCQATTECRENYFRSCEAHGGEMIELVQEVRRILSNNV